jgi:hypothetical protein
MRGGAAVDLSNKISLAKLQAMESMEIKKYKMRMDSPPVSRARRRSPRVVLQVYSQRRSPHAILQASSLDHVSFFKLEACAPRVVGEREANGLRSLRSREADEWLCFIVRG